MKEKISLKRTRERAEELYRDKGFYCSEAVVAAIRDEVDPDMPETIIAVSSGFPAGIGRSKCACGAVTGGVMCLGYFFGRTEPAQLEKSNQTLVLAKELQESFRQNHNGVLCCHVHTKGFRMSAGEHKGQCQGFTGEMAEKTAELIARELNLPLEE